MERRTFLGLTAGAAAGLAAGTAASPLPWRLARDLALWSQNPALLPPVPHGLLREIDTVTQLCPSGAGIRVLMAQGRPLMAKGNPDHPLSQGGITPLGLAEVASLSHPARLAGPLLRVGRERFEPIGWGQARDLVMEKLRQAGPRTAAILGEAPGALAMILGTLLQRLGSSALFAMPSEGLSARRAVALMGGQGQPGYDLDNASLAVALGADAMESLPASLRLRKAVTRGNGGGSGSEEVRFVALGPALGQTAALAHEWIPLPAGKEAHAALGLAWHLFEMGAVQRAAQGISQAVAPDMAELKALVLARFAPPQVELATGIPGTRLAALARELAESPAAVLIPGSPSGEGASLAAMVAGLAVNVLLGRVNRPGGMYLVADVPQALSEGTNGATMPAAGGSARSSGLGATPSDGSFGVALPGMALAGDLPGFLAQVAMGLAEAPQVLLVAGANPVAGLPGTELVARGLARASFTVCFSSFMDETARQSDLILPATLPLERWGGVATPYGLGFALFSLGRPVARPAADARDTGDFLLDVAARLAMPLGYSTMRQVLREQVAGLERLGGYVVRDVPPWQILAGAPQPAPSGDLWKDLLDGRAWAGMRPVAATLSCGATFLAKAMVPDVVDAGYPLTLAVQASARTGSACLGPPLQSVATLRESELRNGRSVARMNGATARSVRLHPGDRVRVHSAAGEIPAVLELDERVMDGHVAMLAGLGRVGFDGLFAGMGHNVRAVLDPMPEAGGATVWAGCAVGVVKE